jgi:hypothetical protein
MCQAANPNPRIEVFSPERVFLNWPSRGGGIIILSGRVDLMDIFLFWKSSFMASDHLADEELGAVFEKNRLLPKTLLGRSKKSISA